MKKTLVLLFLMSASVLSQESQIREDRILVYGEGKSESPPDRAELSFTVVGLGPSIEAAMESAREKLHGITTSLRPIGLTEENLLTSRFYSGDNTDGKAFLSSSRDFRAHMDVLVTVDSLAWLDDVIRVLAGSKAERLSDISFRLRNDSLLMIDARERAVADALLKARTMAGQFGVGLGKLVYLEEVFGLPPYPIGIRPMQQERFSAMGAMEQSGIAFYGGKRFSVEAYVKAVFSIK